MGTLCVRDFDPLFSTITYSTNHFTYNSGLHALRTAFMGSQTLADLVAGIFSGVTDALKTVKHNLQTTWDGIKNAGQFIGNAVLAAVTEGLNSLILSSIEAMMHVVAMVLGTNVTRNADLIGMESDSGTVSLWTEKSATDISIQTTDTVLFDLDVQKFLLGMLLPIDTLGLYFESEIPELNRDMLYFMIALILSEMIVQMEAFEVEANTGSKMAGFDSSLASSTVFNIALLLGSPLYPKLSELVATSKNASLFDNTDQQQLYKEHLQKFLDNWLKVLESSLVLLVAIKNDPSGRYMKVIDKIASGIPSALATLTEGTESLYALMAFVLTLGLGTMLKNSIISTFTTYWPLMLPFLLVILAVEFSDLYVPVVLILLVMTMSVMWFAWEV